MSKLDALKERIRTEMVKAHKPSYKEKLQELLYDPEEEELLEIRAILKELYKDKTIKDEDDVVKVLDMTKACIMLCTNCKELQPHIAKNSWKDVVWFYCDECSWASDFEIYLNI